MSPYRSPQALPDEHMRLVGIVAAHWEFLDVIIQRALAEVMEHDHHRIALLTENIPFRSKMDLLMAYARPFQERRPGVWQDFTKVDKEVRAAYGVRNAYVHARWKVGKHPDLPLRVIVQTKGGKFTITEEETCSCKVAEAAQLIWDTGEAFLKFFQERGLLKS
jgi:hypothetical protein